MLALLLAVAPANSSGVLSPLITAGAVGVGLLTVVGFYLAARAYIKAKSIDTLGQVNLILRGEVDALQRSRDRMERDLSEAMATIETMGEEIKRLQGRTDLVAHQKHLDEQHIETIGVLTRIADESEARNGEMAKLVTTVLQEAREGRAA